MATHHFSPTRFYSTIGSHDPQVRIGDGHTVIVDCIDAWGQDARVRKVHNTGPNPMSGPIFVEGARPGDVLSVEWLRITPSREIGFTRNSLAPNTVDPEYAAQLPNRAAKGRWRVADGRCVIQSPKTRLGKLALPIAPFCGCFGVAPAGGEAISTATSGRFGGNMDYNGFQAGSTVYLPVSVDGALFHLGDGHARQGDGEMSGTGIEISVQAEVRLSVVKDWQIGWPRGEDADYIFTVGNARPLDQAVQHCTTEMSTWLIERHGLDHYAVGLLMGQAVKYDLGNMYDPAYTMVCKMPKAILATL